MPLFVVMLVFTACGGGGGEDDVTDRDIVVTISAIPGIIVPVRGAVPDSTEIETEQYTGTVAWSPAESTFAATTVYTANIALTVKAGYTFTDVASNFFTVAGAVAVNEEDSGNVTAVFPATGAIPDTDVEFVGAVQTGGSSGTANSTGLTLTFDVDPTTLTADNIIVTGATKGSLSGIGITRSLAMSNISVANGATVSVTITSPVGYSVTGSPQTAVTYRLLTIGMEYLGGKIAYILQPGDPGYSASVPHGLIAAIADQSAGIAWITGGSTQTTLNGGTSAAFGTGQANTNAMKNQPGFTGGAAKECDDYVNIDTGTGVYSDWYLPSENELDKLYLNRVAIGGFYANGYWSSYDDSNDKARLIAYTDGTHYSNYKSGLARLRAVRFF
jgi:hypothetical protein